MRVHPILALSALVLTGLLTLGTVSAQPASPPGQRAEWLPLCGKCLEPTVFSKSGIGTANAVARARVTYQDAEEHCEQWSVEDHPNCDKQAKDALRQENGKIYAATADCVHGRMSDANGEDFLYAGLWPKSDRYLAGKTRWRWGPGSEENTGEIVGESGPTNADLVSTTAEILCPDGVGQAPKRWRKRPSPENDDRAIGPPCALNNRTTKTRTMMTIFKRVLVMMTVGGMLAPALPAQSLGQKVKQATKQSEYNGQAQQPNTHFVSTNALSAQGATQTPSATQASSHSADPSSPALQAINRKLEVGGVWLGMPEEAAQAAILKRNPKLAANPHHFGFAETQNTMYTDHILFSDHAPDYSNTVETMDVGLTLQPMKLEVAYLNRHTQYSETQAPTIANAVEALRAKYGPESVILPKDPTSTTTYIWFFDESGNQVKPTDRFGSIAACGQSTPSTVLSMLKQNEPSTVDRYCANVTVLSAALEEWTPRRTLHNGQTMPPGVLFQMSVTAISNPLLEKSTADTRNMLISARKGEQQQKKSSANKNVPVL